MKIGNIDIGDRYPPLIVAEMSGNHNQSLTRALQITEAAAAVGVQALKIQTYTADTITLDIEGGEFTIDDPDSPWAGRRLYDLYKETSTPWEWHEAIFQRAHELGMLCFSTPFDESAVDFLEQFDPPAYKIASFENTNYPLIEKAASTGKPLIVSTGLMSESELTELVELLDTKCPSNFVLLKCTSAYPASPSDCNLITVTEMKNRFACVVGFSDHTLGIGAALAAVALKASIIEKHFTISRQDGGPDALFSMEPNEMSCLVEESKKAFQSLGEVYFGPTPVERPSLKFRQSIYVSRDVEVGEKLSKDNLRLVRPGYGLPPKYLAQIVGSNATKKLDKGKALEWSDFSQQQ